MRTKPENEITLDRAAALTALTCVASFDYGLRIWMLCGAAVIASMITELFCLYLRGEAFRFRHLDAAVLGWSIVMMMPPTISYSLLILSCVFAIFVGRGLFGGKDNPIFPAAAVGYCFALLNHPEQVTSFPEKKEILPLLSLEGYPTVEGISAMWNHSGKFDGDFIDWITGMPGLPIGSQSVLLLAVIACIFLLRRTASPSVFFPMMLLLCAGNLALSLFRNPLGAVVGTALTNQTLFSILFIYADSTYAPRRFSGFLFAIASAVMIFLFTRIFPERAVVDAPILLSVLLSPLAIVLRSSALPLTKRSEVSHEG